MTTTDVGLIVALHEEMDALLDVVGNYAVCGDGGLNSYSFTPSRKRCVATLVGKKGEAEAAHATAQQIEKFSPSVVVNIGISGAVHDDYKVGDVFVPEQAVQYLQNSKMEARKEGGFTVLPGPPAHPPDARLHTKATGFKLNHREAYKAWLAACSADLTLLVPEAVRRNELISQKLIGIDVLLSGDGHEGCGPAVGAAEDFSKWLRSYNRNIKGIDMESAAVLIAAQRRDDPRPALVIRGMSDFGDERKAALDAIGEGALRRYAMRNAVRFFLALLEVGVFSVSAPSGSAEPAGQGGGMSVTNHGSVGQQVNVQGSAIFHIVPAAAKVKDE